MNWIMRCTIVLAVAMEGFIGNVLAESPREHLNQMVEQLQKSPDDNALREQIIAQALTLNPKPSVPDAATMAEGAAEYAFKNAKSNSDYSEAAKQYEKALLLAPWLADDYFNCGVAHEKAGENKEAIRNFNLYLLAAPNANDARDIKKRIGGLQYAEQKSDSVEAVKKAEAKAQAQAVAFSAPVIKNFSCMKTINGGFLLVDVTFDFSTHMVHEICDTAHGSHPCVATDARFTGSEAVLTWNDPHDNDFMSRFDLVSLQETDYWRGQTGGPVQCQKR